MSSWGQSSGPVADSSHALRCLFLKAIAASSGVKPSAQRGFPFAAKKLAADLGLPKLNFQVLRRTMATVAQKKGGVKDVQALGILGWRLCRRTMAGCGHLVGATTGAFAKPPDGPYVRFRLL
jgi:hypothetical protein